MESVLLAERPRPGVAVLTLNRPAVLNALNMDVLTALLAELVRAGADDDVGCIVLTGAGRAFCSGADLKAVHDMEPPEFRRLTEALRSIAAAVRALDKPVVAAVNGHAIAGGFELACLCDFRIAADDAQFSAGDVAVGMSPTSGLSWLLPRIVGMGWAKYLALLSPRIDGRRAVSIGLAQESVPPAELMPRTLAIAEAIARHPRLGVQLTRLALDTAAETSQEAALASELELEDRTFLDAASEEAMMAFVEKRAPRHSLDAADGGQK